MLGVLGGYGRRRGKGGDRGRLVDTGNVVGVERGGRETIVMRRMIVRVNIEAGGGEAGRDHRGDRGKEVPGEARGMTKRRTGKKKRVCRVSVEEGMIKRR